MTKKKESDNENYLILPQGPHTNKLAHKMTSSGRKQAGGRSVIKDKDDDDFTISIDRFEELKSSPSAIKLLDAMVIYSNQLNSPNVIIPLKEYMELRGLSDERKARKQIKNDMELLYSISIHCKGFGKNNKDFLDSRICVTKGIKNSVIIFNFHQDFFNSIPKNQYMYIPKAYFKTNDLYYKYAALFLRRLISHKRFNAGSRNEDIIGIKTLIDADPRFPKFTDKNKEHFIQLIRTPFEKNMNSFEFISWVYTNGRPDNYEEFIKSKIKVNWIDYPDMEKLTNKKMKKSEDSAS